MKPEEQSKILDSVKQKNIKNTLEEDIVLIEATEAALLAKVEGKLTDMPTEEVEIKELACLMCGVIDCREKGTCLRSIYFGAAKRVLQKYTKRK